jgi:lysozyme
MNYKRLKESVEKHEGFSRKVYKDTLGIDTIGYGFAIKDLVLESDIASILLDRKLTDLILQCFNRFQWLSRQPTVIQETVIEMCYQLGVRGFSKFVKTISFLDEGDYQKASIEMLRSKWAAQTPNRAIELSANVKGCIS